MFARLTRAESGDEGETSPMAHINLRTTDGIHLVIHHQDLMVYLPRRNRLGNRIRMRMHHRALGYSEDMKNSQTNRQQACHW